MRLEYDDTHEDAMMKPIALYVSQNIFVYRFTYGDNILFQLAINMLVQINSTIILLRTKIVQYKLYYLLYSQLLFRCQSSSYKISIHVQL